MASGGKVWAGGPVSVRKGRGVAAQVSEKSRAVLAELLIAGTVL